MAGVSVACAQSWMKREMGHHLNLFMYLPKTPFIWHLTSGSYHALELFASIYKWNRDTLLRIKSVY